ncbi:MAG: nitroreductase family protein [Aristaeellaceae bacterium]
MTNETLRVIHERSSCKAFADRAASREMLEAVAHAAIEAPSATNAQPWQIIMVTDQALLGELEQETLMRMKDIPAFRGFYDMVRARGMRLLLGAPAMAIVAVDNRDAYAGYDCGIVCENMALAAQSLGLGSRIVGIPSVAFSGEKAEELKARLRFPAGYDFGLAVLLGEPEQTKAPHEPNPDRITWIPG